MIRQVIGGALAIMVFAQNAGADTRIFLDNAPTPEAYARMLQLDNKPGRPIRMRGIQMHQTEPAGPAPSASVPTAEILAAPVNFALDSDQVPSDFRPYLDNLATALTRPAARNKLLIVTGHTDSQGDAGYNLQLSVRRALAVEAYLVARGVHAEQLVSAGRGESEPVRGREDDHARNRRVEFRLAR